jgi:hypothetical protein
MKRFNLARSPSLLQQWRWLEKIEGGAAGHQRRRESFADDAKWYLRGLCTLFFRGQAFRFFRETAAKKTENRSLLGLETFHAAP